MGRLKGIPTIISPELLHTLASMGHGDDIVLGDANFPTSSVCRAGPKELRADGHTVPALLEAILTLMPLDVSVEAPVALMELGAEDYRKGVRTPIWKRFHEVVDKAEGREVKFEEVERFAFYERAKKAFAVVHTGEPALYANIILKMGVIKEPQ